VVPASEIDRLKGGQADRMSARNHFRGVVRDVKVEGLLAQVEIDVTEPTRLVAIITRDAAEELGLKRGVSAAGVVKATSVMVEL
jgi:molybdopterin-binding protein